MKPIEPREEREAIKEGLKVWRPWQLKPLEIFQVVDVSFPSCQRFLQEYLLVFWQLGTIHSHHYRNTRLSGPVVDGTFLVIEPGETWSCHSKDFTMYCLFIDPAWLQQFAAEMLHREKYLPHFPSHPLSDPSLCRVVHDLATRSLTSASRLQQEETLLHLFAPLLLSHSEDAGALPQRGWEHPAIKRAKAYLQAHYAEEVALQELAGVTNMSPFHLSHIFRQAVGLPPHAYQTKLRLARAKTLLMQGFDVSYVAMETGFCDQSHLTRQFKRDFLVTPGSYRKTARFF